MSSTVPGRAIGVLASNCARSSSFVRTTCKASVATPPTEMALTRTFGATSAARFRVIMLSAAFAAP